MKVYLALGSNIDPKKDYILRALKKLEQSFDSLVCSSLYQTNSYQDTEQDYYLNLIASLETEKSAEEVLAITQKIETELERPKIRQKKQPRTIDIDILFYGKEVIHTKDLIIPHYDLWNRDFFLLPLLELEKENKLELQKALEKIPIENRTAPKKIGKIVL